MQTPQHFINPDPLQTNLSIAGVWPDEQRYFFDVVLASKDAWGAAFCCGTSSVIRFSELQRIGGFPTDSVTEDYLVTLKMKQAGYPHRLSQRAAVARPGAGGPQGIHHAAQPLGAGLHADLPRAASVRCGAATASPSSTA